MWCFPGGWFGELGCGVVDLGFLAFWVSCGVGIILFAFVVCGLCLLCFAGFVVVCWVWFWLPVELSGWLCRLLF